MKQTQTKKIYDMVLLAILVAIMLIFNFTPLGFLKLGAIEITFMILPIAIGAILLGPTAGAILGALFGILSFIQCFGASPIGIVLLGINPFFTFITCIVPRVLCGLLSGLIYKAFSKIDKTKIVSYYIASLSTAVINTVLFVGCIILFFWQSPDFIKAMTDFGISTDTVWLFIVGFVAINGVIEAAANFIIGASVAKVVAKAASKVSF